jgi:hypothetical protein
MAYITDFTNEYKTAKVIDAIVDETLTNLLTRSEVLNKIAPVREYEDWNFLGLLTNNVRPVASVVGIGQEFPTTSSGSFEKVTAEMCKIALSIHYDEEKQVKMREAMHLAYLNNTQIQHEYDDYTGTIVQRGVRNDLAKLIFGCIAALVQGVMDRLDSMTWEMLQTGALTIVDNRTLINKTIDFKKAGASYNHFPAALTATGNPTKKLNKWTDYANADGLANLYDGLDTYVDTNGFPPDGIIMGRKAYNDLLQQATTKDAARSLAGYASIGTVSPGMLNNVLEARGLPNIYLVDDRYQIEQEDKTIVNARFVADNRFLFFKNDMSQRAVAPTLESDRKTVEDGGHEFNVTPGLYVETYEKSKQPILDVSFAVIRGLPLTLNPKLFYSQIIK